MTKTEPVDELASALGDMEQLVASVEGDQWPQQTPCTDWTVRELVNHFVGGNYIYASTSAPRCQADEMLRSPARPRLGRGAAAPRGFSDSAAEQGLAFTRSALTKIPPGRVFAGPQPVADDAPALDRLAALLGRPVQSTATATGT